MQIRIYFTKLKDFLKINPVCLRCGTQEKISLYEQKFSIKKETSQSQSLFQSLSLLSGGTVNYQYSKVKIHLPFCSRCQKKNSTNEALKIVLSIFSLIGTGILLTIASYSTFFTHMNSGLSRIFLIVFGGGIVVILFSLIKKIFKSLEITKLSDYSITLDGIPEKVAVKLKEIDLIKNKKSWF